MPRYSVTVRYEQEKKIGVWARDEDQARERAEEVVMGWNGVISADADDVDEE